MDKILSKLKSDLELLSSQEITDLLFNKPILSSYLKLKLDSLGEVTLHTITYDVLNKYIDEIGFFYKESANTELLFVKASDLKKQELSEIFIKGYTEFLEIFMKAFDVKDLNYIDITTFSARIIVGHELTPDVIEDLNSRLYNYTEDCLEGFKISEYFYDCSNNKFECTLKIMV